MLPVFVQQRLYALFGILVPRLVLPDLCLSCCVLSKDLWSEYLVKEGSEFGVLEERVSAKEGRVRHKVQPEGRILQDSGQGPSEWRRLSSRCVGNWL